MGTRRIGILGYEHVTALDIAGPADVFATASGLSPSPSGEPAYEVVLIGPTPRPFSSDAGLVLTPAKSFKTAPALDTLIIPGGHLLRDPLAGRRHPAHCLRLHRHLRPGPNGAPGRAAGGHALEVRRGRRPEVPAAEG
jgi:transcriptional regulator GlxA family with amidase domain